MATHSFLKKDDFFEIKAALIPDYYPNVDLNAIADNGVYVGFIGLSPDSITRVRDNDIQLGDITVRHELSGGRSLVA